MIVNPSLCNTNAVVLATLALMVSETLNAIAGNEISTRINGQSLNAELVAELAISKLSSATVA